MDISFTVVEATGVQLGEIIMCRNKMNESYVIEDRVQMLAKNASARWKIAEKDCHIGFLVLQAMLQDPDGVNQIDGATDQRETNNSVAKRAAQLASAMKNAGLRPGDTVIIMANNNIDMCIPFYACHFNGYSVCAMDPLGASDLKKLWPYVNPSIIFCQKSCLEKIEEAFEANNKKCEVVTFENKETNMEQFIRSNGGTEINFRPAIFDQSETAAWLILTSGTTGLPKVAIIPFDRLINAIQCWWEPYPENIKVTFLMSPLQWMTGLFYTVAGPIKSYTRLQSSEPLTPQSLITIINKYKPCTTAWSASLLGQFLKLAENVCDLSFFKYIVIGGCAIEKPLFERLRKSCQATVSLVYGMSELLVPIFNFSDSKTPLGSCGKPFLDKYEYKLVDDDDKAIKERNHTGELWIKGNAFFKGYKNNAEETSLILTDDGWFKTGDMFYRSDEDYYYFVERKRLLIKHYGIMISPLEMESVLLTHPGVSETCVVNMPMHQCMELPVAAILKKADHNVDFQNLFNLLDKNFAVGKKLSTGFFFVESVPLTPTGKVHRAKVKEMATFTDWQTFHRAL